eukprot:gene22758-29465_t
MSSSSYKAISENEVAIQLNEISTATIATVTDAANKAGQAATQAANQAVEVAHHVTNAVTSGANFINKKLFHQSFDNTENFSTVFDYVMVFPLTLIDAAAKTYAQSKEAKYYIQVMLAEGLELFTYLSVQGDELIVLIHCPEKKLKKFADEIDFKLLLDVDVSKHLLAAGNKKDRIKEVHINHDPSIIDWEPTEYIYGKFDEHLYNYVYKLDNGEERSLYSYPEGYNNPFSEQIRLKLIYYLLKAPRKEGFYPLHNQSKAKVLLKKCLDRSNMPWRQPIEEIRDYYGEKIALYNLFLGHYTKYLIGPSIIGLVFQLVVWGTLDFSHPVLPFFGVVISVWSILMLEGWKRKEAMNACRWGMTDFESSELDRPEFEGKPMKSYINGKDILYFPRSSLYAPPYLTKPNGVDQTFLGQCGATNCMQPLGMNLGIIFGVRLIVQNIVDLFVPYVQNKLKFRNETKGTDLERTPLTPAEKDYVLLPYNPMMDNINNYADTAIQYGYMILFITALPIACFCSVINSYFKIRVLAIRNAKLYQRPIPAGAQDIGTWQTIFNIISVVGVITNAALICFTMNVLDEAIPDVPEKVEIQLARQEFIVDKLIIHEPDENYGEVEEVEEHHDPVDLIARKKNTSVFHTKGTKKLKGADRLSDIETFAYPFEKKENQWPEILSRDPHNDVANNFKKVTILDWKENPSFRDRNQDSQSSIKEV